MQCSAVSWQLLENKDFLSTVDMDQPVNVHIISPGNACVPLNTVFKRFVYILISYILYRKHVKNVMLIHRDRCMEFSVAMRVRKGPYPQCSGLSELQNRIIQQESVQ